MELDIEDVRNIKTSLKYVIHDMRSNYFRDLFTNTLEKIEKMEGERKNVL